MGAGIPPAGPRRRKKMAKPRNKTLGSGFGFKDEDHGRPTHDEVVKWVEKNRESIVRNAYENKSPALLSWFHDQCPDISDWRVVWEKPVVDERYKAKYIVGYIDLCLEKSRDWNSIRLAFEAKTKSESLGVWLRQINTYRTYEPSALFFLVCPEDDHREALERQGVVFVKAFEGEENPCAAEKKGQVELPM
jgi:hypothetical protein